MGAVLRHHHRTSFCWLIPIELRRSIRATLQISGTHMTIYLHHNDLPDDVDLGASIAIDSETMGLNPHRDRLCVVQLSAGDGDAHLVKFDGD